ncbi:porin Gram-negative type [Shewanella halifaxensis HAW-EB4]|uniref:Porin Gram-negative type n=1 Tax=Shewanella halifaxensis (strain HAW-EB4) TaxID=458817 RepID=B0TSS7_SHEHH|nr:porin [Shewanella halifaxensis]ABZ75252.1 porin Gram-negative type [Shewanella halifaxensis HAW-EB4]
MKKTVLSATIISALAATSFTALADGPNFYGRADLAITNSDMGIATQNQKSGTVIENNFSWLGVKGTEAINSELEVVYQMEFGVNNFDNSGNTFSARNTFLGLKSATAGTILVGRNDTVFKASEGGFDIFGNTNSDIDLFAAGQSRNADGFTYYSPKIAGLVTLNATYLMDDNYAQEVDGKKVDTDNMYALSATIGDKGLKAQNYYVAAAYNDSIDNVKAYRGVAQVKLGQVILGGFYQNSEHVDSKYANLEGDTYFVNAAYVMGDLKLKAMYGSDDSGLGKYVSRYVGSVDGATLENVSDVDLQQFSVGADYRLSKNTLVYGHYTKYDGDIKLAGATQDLSDDIFTVGMRFDF